MTEAAFERGDWQAVIDAHPLESHDSAEWLRYGVSLLQCLEPGPEAGRQQQQAALAFEQAKKEAATAEEVRTAQRQAVMLSLGEALSLVGITAVPKHGWESSVRVSEPGSDQAGASVHLDELGAATLPTVVAGAGQDPPKDPLQSAVSALAAGFGLQLPAEVSLLDQLLAAKQQLKEQQVTAAAVENLLLRVCPLEEQAWADARQKVLLVLRLPGA